MESECCARQLPSPETEAALRINAELSNLGLYRDPQKSIHVHQNSTWRISPEPFVLDSGTYQELVDLGHHLARFNITLQRLYEHSLRGKQPAWITEYLAMGKPDRILELERMRRFRRDMPFIIRPDIILTEQGFVATELDAVPGGFGLLGALSKGYANLGYDLVGGAYGIPNAFARCIQELADEENPYLAIVVSNESDSYRGEMEWLARELDQFGVRAATIHPQTLSLEGTSLYCTVNGRREKIDVVYRFFELFDLSNIPNIDQLLEAVRQKSVKIAPPFKSFLEEKLAFALLHSAHLQEFWQRHLGSESFDILRNVFPRSWVVDSRPLPPHAVIPGLQANGRPVTDWRDLANATKQERELVLKVSGFSELSWGSRGVFMGHDMPSAEWSDAIDTALSSFGERPYVLQEFHKGRKVETKYYDFQSHTVQEMQGRVRLCPYYFALGDEVELAGVLATICPLDKKLIHGMVDAVMVPTQVARG